jgi:hypothetical protein
MDATKPMRTSLVHHRGEPTETVSYYRQSQPINSGSPNRAIQQDADEAHWPDPAIQSALHLWAISKPERLLACGPVCRILLHAEDRRQLEGHQLDLVRSTKL